MHFHFEELMRRRHLQNGGYYRRKVLDRRPFEATLRCRETGGYTCCGGLGTTGCPAMNTAFNSTDDSLRVSDTFYAYIEA